MLELGKRFAMSRDSRILCLGRYISKMAPRSAQIFDWSVPRRSPKVERKSGPASTLISAQTNVANLGEPNIHRQYVIMITIEQI